MTGRLLLYSTKTHSLLPLPTKPLLTVHAQLALVQVRDEAPETLLSQQGCLLLQRVSGWVGESVGERVREGKNCSGQLCIVSQRGAFHLFSICMWLNQCDVGAHPSSQVPLQAIVMMM
jgi:hypothetical protein